MGCDEARDLLIALHEGELDELQSAEVREHLEVCGACQRESESTARFLRVWRASFVTTWEEVAWPPEGTPHLSSEELVTLAEFAEEEHGVPPGAMQTRWKRYLDHLWECASCFGAWRFLRNAVMTSETVPTEAQVASVVRALSPRREERRLEIALSWLGARLSGSRGLHRPELALATRGPESEHWRAEKRLGDYTIAVTVSAERPGERLSRLTVELLARPPEVQEESVQVSLSRDDLSLRGLVGLREGVAKFSRLAPGEYVLAVEVGEEIVAEIGLSVGAAA